MDVSDHQQSDATANEPGPPKWQWRPWGRIAITDRRALLLIFLLGLGLRLLYLRDISDQPFFRELVVDEAAYDRWAWSMVSTGNWLGAQTFYQDPLYPYFLAILYQVFGRNLLAVYVLQCLLAAACCFPMFGIGRRAFADPRAGLWAALFWALYKVDYFYEAQIDKTGPGTCLVIVALWLLLKARDRPGLRTAAGAGLASGLLLLYRGNFLLAVPALFAWLAWSLGKRGARAALGPVFALALAAALVLGLSAWRNYKVSGELILTTAQGGENFYMGNFRGNPWGTGVDPPFIRRTPEFEAADFAAEARIRTGQDLSPAALSRFWYGEGLREIKDDPGLFLVRLGRKALLILNRHEASDNLNYDFFCDNYSLVLRSSLPGFWLPASLGMAGLVLALSRRKGGILSLYLLAYSITLLVFYVLGRYRSPLAPPLMAFAGYGLVAGWSACKARNRKSQIIFFSALAVFGALSSPRWLHPTYAPTWAKLGNIYAGHQRWAEAISAYEKAIQEKPDFGWAWIGLGLSYRETGREEEALKALQNALALDPRSPEAHFLLGQVYESAGDRETARQEYQTALRYDPSFPQARAALSRLPPPSPAPP